MFDLRDSWVWDFWLADDGFGQLEVMQVEVVAGRAVLVFSCLDRHSTPARRSEHGGTWAVNAPGVTGPFDVSTAYPLTSDDLYVGRLLRPRDSDEWLLFAFQNKGPAGVFTGGVTDPMPVRWEDGGLTVGPPDPGGSRPAADPSADQGAARRPATTSDGVS